MSATAMSTCWFARFDAQPCRGLVFRCHLIPKQRINRAGRGEHNMDPRVLRYGCEGHHDRFDGRNAINKLILRHADYPLSVLEFAQEFGFFWAGEREGWLAEADAG